jgi:hypothetical protein
MELEGLAEKMGIQVIHEKLSQSRGGLCRLHDEYLLFVEKNLSAEEQVQLLVSALCRFPLDDIQMLPAIRDLLTGEAIPELAYPGLYEPESSSEISLSEQ